MNANELAKNWRAKLTHFLVKPLVTLLQSVILFISNTNVARLFFSLCWLFGCYYEVALNR